MSDFNRMTIVAAAEVIAFFKSHSDMEVMEIQWNIDRKVYTSNKSSRIGSWVKLACEEDIVVITENGRIPLAQAIVECAITMPRMRSEPKDIGAFWKKLIAGLRFDGFEIIEKEITEHRVPFPKVTKAPTLIRMLPEDIQSLDFRETENEISELLKKFGFNTAKGHLEQAVSAFQRGEWSSANGELRNFFESYLNEIADALGYSGKDDSKLRRDFLGEADAPFLFTEYNEWNSNIQKPQYVQGLMSRMHPHGGHPGLSEEEDATFRLQIMLITARLFLRRFKQRKD
ncbi:MAG: hypothetical protein CMK74_05375 [Pseudomonadales bacterium]|nr:hypothetical protein [Pseudomonadales bacterium]